MTALAWILVALGALVLVLTPLRLRRARGQEGMTNFAPWVLNLHTLAAFIGLGLITLRLLGVHESGAATWAAIIAMVVAALIGLSFLARWRRSGSRHSVDFEGDTWTRGPWLSQLAHIGFVIGTLIFTWMLLGDTI
ncbi:MAG: hypothetical protein ACTMHL_12630 [Janibacter sp.]